MSLAPFLGALALTASAPDVCQREIVVLGAGQDAGAPQIGNASDTGPRLLPSSLGVIDRENGQRFLFDATPAITEQLAMLDRIEPPESGPNSDSLGIDGVFLTHAHIGHYLGLAYFGREAAGADKVPVFAMWRMAKFLRENAPWNQLLRLGNISVTEMEQGGVTSISDEFGVLPITVPHRDEFSETVGFLIMTLDKSALYVPDLDSWDEFAEAGGGTLEDLIGGVDYAFIDATFWDDNELTKADGTGRDMSEIPHPRVSGTMDRLAALSDSERAKVHFIHYNHTNPVRDPNSAESREVSARGFNVARRGDRVCLSR